MGNEQADRSSLSLFQVVSLRLPRHYSAINTSQVSSLSLQDFIIIIVLDILFLLLKKNYLFNLKGSLTQGNRERHLPCTASLPNGHKGQDWARSEPEARNSFWITHTYLWQGPRYLGHHLLSSQDISRKLDQELSREKSKYWA